MERYRFINRFRALRSRGRNATAGREQEEAFTLLELLVVLMIISLAAGLVVPRIFSPMSTTALRTAGKQISAGLRWARSTAVTRHVEVVSVFDVAGNRVVIKEKGEDVGNAPAGSDPIRWEYQLPETVSMVSGSGGRMQNEAVTVVFYPTGNSTGGSMILRNDRRQLQITVDFITGATYLAELQGS